MEGARGKESRGEKTQRWRDVEITEAKVINERERREKRRERRDRRDRRRQDRRGEGQVERRDLASTWRKKNC